VTATIRALLLLAVAASLVLMYRAGHRNPSVVLMLMFTVWVSSPFVALDVVTRFARNWPQRRQTPLRLTAILVAIGSVCLYGIDAVTPLSPKAAFLYLVVPLASWVAIVVALAVAKSRR
jgi:hypothetical protein